MRASLVKYFPIGIRFLLDIIEISFQKLVFGNPIASVPFDCARKLLT